MIMQYFFILFQIATATFLFVHACIFLHELAHAVVGYLCGFKPKIISIGHGARILRVKINRLTLIWHLLPNGGKTVNRTLPLSGLWWRGALFSLAGPAIEFVMLIYFANVEAQPGGIAYYMIPICFFILLSGLITNLSPDGKCLISGTPNDGTQFLGYLKGETSSNLDILLDGLVVEISRYDPGFSLSDSKTLTNDSEVLFDFLEVSLDCQAGEHKAATDKLDQLLLEDNLHPAERVILYDQIACIPLISGDKKHLDTATDYVEKAFQLFPESKTLWGTYGALLAEQGYYRRAKELLLPLTTEGNHQGDISIACCYLAKMAFEETNSADGRDWLHRAQQSGGEFVINERIEKELIGEYGQSLAA